MPRRRRPYLAQRMLELAWSSPQVIAHRMSHADSAEQTRMVTEKWAAGMESWNAMAAYSLALQRSLLRDAIRAPSFNGFLAGAPLFAWMRYMRHAERGMSDAAAPFHRRARANAKRLSSPSRRRRQS